MSAASLRGLLVLAASVACLAGSLLWAFWPTGHEAAAGRSRPEAAARSGQHGGPPSAIPTTGGPKAAPGTFDLGPAPRNGTGMRLTIPALKNVRDIPVKNAPGNETWPLRTGAQHVAGTGYPWQRGADTYIAGHRLGFPGTKSDHLFWYLETLKTGDMAYLTDSDGRRYSYRVYGRVIVGPKDASVARPIPGKDVLSLQTCTLPNYTRRLVIRAALVQAPRQNGPSPAPPKDPGGAFGA